jgi:hypothetical protein
LARAAARHRLRAPDGGCFGSGVSCAGGTGVRAAQATSTTAAETEATVEAAAVAGAAAVSPTRWRSPVALRPRAA